MRRLIRYLSFACGGGIIGLLGLIFIAHCQFFQPYLTWTIEKSLEKTSIGELHIDGFKGKWLGHFEIDTLQFNRDSKRVVAARGLNVSWKPWASLLRRVPVVTSLSAAKLHYFPTSSKSNSPSAGPFNYHKSVKKIKQFLTAINGVRLSDIRIGDERGGLSCVRSEGWFACEAAYKEHHMQMKYHAESERISLYAKHFDLTGLPIASMPLDAGWIQVDLQAVLGKRALEASGNIGLHDLRVNGKPGIYEGMINVRYQKQVGEIDAKILTGGEKTTLHMNLARSNRIDAAVPLSLLPRALGIDELVLGGVLKARVELNKSWQPLLGQVSLEGGRLAVEPIGELQPVVLEASIKQNKLILTRLEANQRGRQVATGTGEIQLQSLRGEGQLKLDGLAVSIPGQYSARLDGELALEPSSKITGQIVVKHFERAGNGFVAKQIPSLNIVKSSNKVPKSSDGNGQGPSVPIAIEVKTDKPLKIKDKGIWFLAGLGLHVTGDAASPIVSGRVALEEGSVDFLSRHFLLAKSAITIKENVAHLNLDFSTSLSDYLIRLQILGTSNKPQIRLSSKPELPQNQIIAKLVFDTDFDKLSPVQVIQVMKLISELKAPSGFSVGTLENKLSDILHLDRLVMDYFPKDGLVLGVSKHIGDKVSIQLDKALQSVGDARAKIEVKINQHLNLEGGMGSADEKPSLKLNWKHDY